MYINVCTSITGATLILSDITTTTTLLHYYLCYNHCTVLYNHFTIPTPTLPRNNPPFVLSSAFFCTPSCSAWVFSSSPWLPLSAFPPPLPPLVSPPS